MPSARFTPDFRRANRDGFLDGLGSWLTGEGEDRGKQTLSSSFTANANERSTGVARAAPLDPIPTSIDGEFGSKIIATNS